MNKLSLFIICLFVSNVFATDIKFGNVSKEEVMEEMHPLENDAEAAILYQREYTSYEYNYDEGWSLHTDVHIRIKIYSSEGFGYATLPVYLYRSRQGKEKVSGIKGFTFNMVDGKLVSEKLKKDGIFVEDVNDYRQKVSITMPEVKEGSVIDIQYKTMSPLFWYLSEYTFQYGIPTNRVEVKLKVPEYFVFQRYSKGFYPINFKQSTSPRKINVQYRTADQAGRVGRTTHKSGTLDFKENVYEISASNLPSVKEEVLTDNIDNYRTAIKFELSSTRFPNSPYKYYSQSWEDVAKSIYDYSSFGAELRKSGYFEKDLEPLLEGVTDRSEKIDRIFNYVKTKMTWDGNYGVGCDNGVKQAYKESNGNVADINLMLTAMLRWAGVNANPILVSTKSHGIPLFPTTEGFNYVICGVEVTEDVILLDATDKYSTADVLPERVLNWSGRLVRKEGSSSEVVLVPKHASKRIFMTNVSIEDNGDVNGKTRMQRTDHFALDFRNTFQSTDEETYLEDLENKYGGIEISGYEIKNSKTISKPIIETCEFYKESQCEIIGDKLMIAPMMFFAIKENPFKLEKREYPINYSFPRQSKYMINIEIPEGYALESVPENKILQLPENLGSFKYMIKKVDNKLQLVVSSEIRRAVIPATYYDLLKEYYKQVISKETEKVVFIKT